MQKHTLLSQTKHIELAVSVLPKHPLLLSEWNQRLQDIWKPLFHTIMAYKKLCYFSSSHKLAPWENQCWQPKLISCLSAWVTHLAPPATHPCPNPALTPWSAWAGKHLPSWSFKINQNGGKGTQSWQLCLGSWKENSPPHLSGQTTSQGAEHQPGKSLLQLQGETAQLILPGCSVGKPS